MVTGVPARRLAAVRPEEAKLHAPKKLDIACGINKTPGFKGIDLGGKAEITHDLFSFPWPIKTSSVSEAVCNHFVEHIPHYRPEFNGVDGFFLFFDEVHRILKKGATITLTHPYVRNERAFWDPTHTRFIHEMNYYYLDPAWREMNGLQHYPTKSDFEVVTISTGLSDEMMARNEAQQQYARVHYWNAVGDLAVVLKARK